MMKIDMNKKYKTKDGSVVKIITVTGYDPTKLDGNPYPVRGYIENDYSIQYWTKEGKYYYGNAQSIKDLVEDIKIETEEFKMKIDMNKKYKTYAGEEVELITTNHRNPDYPVIGYVGKGSRIYNWNDYGVSSCDSDFNLIHIEEDHEYYVNFYMDNITQEIYPDDTLYVDRAAALYNLDNNKSDNKIYAYTKAVILKY